MNTPSPRSSRPQSSHGIPAWPNASRIAIQSITDRHLVRIGAPLIPEPLNVHHNDGPVNGRPLILHRLTPPEQAEATL
jgi:hypothetical protein